MGHLCYEYPMDRFKELEPLLKQWFNIDRNTTTISKCLSISFTADQLMQIQSQIPDNYRGENGHSDIVRYAYDYSDVLRMPLTDTVNADDLFEFFNNNRNLVNLYLRVNLAVDAYSGCDTACADTTQSVQRKQTVS